MRCGWDCAFGGEQLLSQLLAPVLTILPHPSSLLPLPRQGARSRKALAGCLCTELTGLCILT